MLTVGAALHNDCAAVELIDVYQRNGRFVSRQSLDERGNIVRQSWPSLVGIKISQSSDERVAAHTWMNAAHGEFEQAVDGGGVVFHRIIGEAGVGRRGI